MYHCHWGFPPSLSLLIKDSILSYAVESIRKAAFAWSNLAHSDLLLGHKPCSHGSQLHSVTRELLIRSTFPSHSVTKVLLSPQYPKNIPLAHPNGEPLCFQDDSKLFYSWRIGIRKEERTMEVTKIHKQTKYTNPSYVVSWSQLRDVFSESSAWKVWPDVAH